MATQKVLIIGGGVMGCGIGFRLAQAGADVTVLERAIPGAEASSAAAGILAPQMETEKPGPFLDLCLRSRAMYGDFARELKELTSVDIHYLPSGLMNCAFTEAAAARLDATVSWQTSFSLRAELLTGDQARKREPQLSSEVLAAAYFPDDHQVDNRLLVRALSMAAALSGVRFRTGYVRSIVVEGDRAVGVDLDGETLRADCVVVAAGSWSGLVPNSGLDPKRVRPAKGQMVALQTRLPLFSSVLFCPEGYLVPRSDGRVIAGSTVEFKGFEKSVTAAGLAKILGMAMSLLPALSNAPIEETWAGLRPYTEDHTPLMGPGPLPGLFLATGHFRNGILLAPITARVVSEAVLGKKTLVDLRPFSLGHA